MIETWSYKFIDRVKPYLEYMLTLRHLVEASIDGEESKAEKLCFFDLPEKAQQLISDKFIALTENINNPCECINEDIKAYLEERGMLC